MSNIIFTPPPNPGGSLLTGVQVFSASSKLDLSASTVADTILLRAQDPICGIAWGATDKGFIGYLNSSSELKIQSRKAIAIAPSGSFQGDGFLQFGNNGPTSEIVFVSQEGAASASVVNVRSHRLNLNSAWWNGSASVDVTSTLQSTTDSTGAGVIEFFPTGTRTTGSYNAGTGRYDYSDATRILGIHSAGLRTIRSATSAPAYSFDTSTTTGMGCDTGGTLFLTRSGTTYLSLDSTFGVLVGQVMTCQGRVGLSAGASGFNSIHRTSDTTTGFYFPATGTIAFQLSGTERFRMTPTDLVFTPPSSAAALATNGQVTFELTNNTTLTFRARGADGTTRSGTITLA